MTSMSQQRARSFGDVADVYDRSRPGYPAEALDWLLPAGSPGRPLRVLDLGAGTGKLTRSLLARDLDVVAVEPTPGMREQFAKVLPGVEVLDGTGESIPLDMLRYWSVARQEAYASAAASLRREMEDDPVLAARAKA